MGHAEDSQRDDGRTDQGRTFVYLPCPACRRGVRLSDDNRVDDEPDEYGCPSCGSRFFVSTAES